MNVSPLLKSQMYYPLLLMKTDGTQLDKTQLDKTQLVKRDGSPSVRYSRVLLGTESCLNMLHLSLSLVLMKTVKKVQPFVKLLRKQ